MLVLVFGCRQGRVLLLEVPLLLLLLLLQIGRGKRWRAFDCCGR